MYLMPEENETKREATFDKTIASLVTEILPCRSDRERCYVQNVCAAVL